MSNVRQRFRGRTLSTSTSTSTRIALSIACLIGLAADDPGKKKDDPKSPTRTASVADASKNAKTAKNSLSAPPTIKPDESTKTRNAADLLRASGSDRYGETDWSRIPRWRQTAFFGIRAEGQVFIYVIDCSGSMGEGFRLERAKEELRKSINALRFPQRFHVIFFNGEPIPMPGDLARSADFDNKMELSHWLARICPEGETDPRGALKTAISLRPDAVFLLTDGEFPEGTAAGIAKSNKTHVPIHCVDLSGGESEQLRQIAKDSNGKYVRSH